MNEYRPLIRRSSKTTLNFSSHEIFTFLRKFAVTSWVIPHRLKKLAVENSQSDHILKVDSQLVGELYVNRIGRTARTYREHWSGVLYQICFGIKSYKVLNLIISIRNLVLLSANPNPTVTGNVNLAKLASRCGTGLS